jgi:hypothetical protein
MDLRELVIKHNRRRFEEEQESYLTDDRTPAL